jgi:hypothetical protein
MNPQNRRGQFRLRQLEAYMATKEIKVVRPDRLSTVKVDWTKRGGFKVSAVENVDQLPKGLGVDVATNSALVGVRVSGRGAITIAGLDKIIRRPGGLAAEGRCTM